MSHPGRSRVNWPFLVAVGFMAVTIRLADDAARMDAEVRECADVTVGLTPVDFSHPGTCHAPFTQVCDSRPFQNFYLELGSPLPPGQSLRAAAADLDGTVSFRDANGAEVARTEIGHCSDDDPDPLRLWVGMCRPFPKGDYMMTVEITCGAGGLTGTEQRFYSRYRLCGCELLPALGRAALAIPTGLCAVGLGIGGLSRWLRNRRPATG